MLKKEEMKTVNGMTEGEYFIKTGIGGSYEFSDIDMHKTFQGKMLPMFDDAELWTDLEGNKIKRSMCVDGRVFHVCSVFPMDDGATSTERLLEYIDSELEKK